MGVTFNRRPLSFSGPNSNDIKQYYFNHYNWKGINQNKNLLVVDQETFADANNVYVDDEGLLKSRLPLKLYHKFSDKILKDIKVFGDVVVIAYELDDEQYIGIVKDETWKTNREVNITLPIKAFRNGNFVYIFTNDRILSYNTETNIIDDALMYYPVVTTYVGDTAIRDGEEENLFSDYSRYKYPLDGTKTIQTVSSDIYGKDLSYTHIIRNEMYSHNVNADYENKFLNQIHDQFSEFTDYYCDTNVYRDEVPTCFIEGDFMYRYNSDKEIIERASLSDLIFTEFIKPSDVSSYCYFEKFVKFNQGDGLFTIVYEECALIYDYNGAFIGEIFGDMIFDTYFTIISNTIYGISIKNTKIDLDNNEELVIYVYRGGPGASNIHRKIYCGTTVNKLSSSIAIGVEYRIVTAKIILGSPYTDIISIDVTDANITPTNKFNSEDCYFEQINNGNYRYYKIGRGSYGNNLYYTDKFYGFLNYDGKVYFGQLDGVEFEYETESIADTYYHNGAALFYIVTDGFYLYDNKLITDYRIYEDFTFVPKIIITKNYWFYILENDVVLSNYRRFPINLYADVPNVNKYNGLDLLVKGNRIYGSKNNELYIGNVIVDFDKQEKLYFEKINKSVLDSKILGLHQISDTELAIFTEDDTWYNTLSDGVYYYNRSKIVPTLKGFSDIITLPDSTTTLMPSINGVVALSYQNFINTAEQSTTNLTQDLSNLYSEFSNEVKNINWKNYTIFYEIGNSKLLIFDIRLASWWRWTIPVNISTLFVYDNILYVLNESGIYRFVEDGEYTDTLDTDSRLPVDWFVESQKLHLNANNYYKHITNITLASVDSGEQPINLNLNIKNYRKFVDVVNKGEAENFSYDIDVIRTYVKRLNYAKVCEFQYKLSSNDEERNNIPLALSNITIKYKIGGQVR